MTSNLLDSAATFKRCTAEKLSFVVLNQLDLVLTVAATSLGLVELNPLMRSLVTAPVLLFLFKSLVPVVIAWLAPGKLLLPAIVLLVCILAWDVKELLLFLF